MKTPRVIVIEVVKGDYATIKYDLSTTLIGMKNQRKGVKQLTSWLEKNIEKMPCQS